jgi:hypothetical protein
MPHDHRERLRSIRQFHQLVEYLCDDLQWPIETADFEDLTFDYEAEDLGLDFQTAAKIQQIKQLRPLVTNQPWGIFFVQFEPKRLPVVALRRILGRLVIKKRSSANKSELVSWQLHDLLFISSYGEGDNRQISLAHFSENEQFGDLPTLRVLGWDGNDRDLKLDHVHNELQTKLCWPEDDMDLNTWREQWSSVFMLRHREVITTSQQLAVRLADLASSIRRKVNAALAVETEQGPMRKLMQAFQEALIHDLKADDFADMYAQTIAYGRLSARVSRQSGALVVDDVALMVPITSPFLRELMETFLHLGGRKQRRSVSATIDFDELGINDVVDVLRQANMEAVLRDFDNCNPQEDPVLHFYELFLKEYDAKKRMQRGVFYTPKPVVSYIVRSVHELLQHEFGLEDGLADTATWQQMCARHPDITMPQGVSPDQPFVQILDPATKRHQRFTIIIGNPPYSGNSANTGEWISQLVQDYYQVDGTRLGERNPKWLQDDYVKFTRAGQFLCGQTSLAVFGFITNHGYIDNPTFRGMRQSLLATFCELWVFDLHGNIKKKETAPDGGLDENVFDIQQGVAIFLATRGTTAAVGLKQSDLFGTRADKYATLSKNTVKSLPWREVKPVSPFYVFLPQDEDVRAEYLRCYSIKQAMPVNVLGFQTHRDHFAVAFDRDTIVSRCEALRNSRLKDAEIKTRFELSDNRDWNVHNARRAIRDDAKWKSHIIRCLYRPFDVRWCYFSTVAMDYPRRELLDHVAEKENLCLLVPRQISFLPWQHTGVSDTVAESCLVSTKTEEQNYNFPLYLYPESDSLALASRKHVNFSEPFLREIAIAFNSPQHGPHGLPQGLMPEDIFYYVYAVLHSLGYRSRYAEFLKIDFPRLPLTGNLALFRALARLGGELVSLHLMESPNLDQHLTTYVGPAHPEVEKISYSRDTVWLDKLQTRGFRGLPEEVWNFHIGGYQVCEKWLKDRQANGGKNPRPGRQLNEDDINHYQRIVVALHETIRLMGAIDAVINQHGGWPDAFMVEPVPREETDATESSA